MAPPTPERAQVVVGTFDPVRMFPPGEPLTVPLLREVAAELFTVYWLHGADRFRRSQPPLKRA